MTSVDWQRQRLVCLSLIEAFNIITSLLGNDLHNQMAVQVAETAKK